MNYKHFNKLHVPETWQHYFTKYPQGHTILESLIEWVSQVDSMTINLSDINKTVKEFINTFDNKLGDKVQDTLKEWQESGFLEIIISAAIDLKIDDLENDVANAKDNIENINGSITNITQDIAGAVSEIANVASELINTNKQLENVDQTTYKSNNKRNISYQTLVDSVTGEIYHFTTIPKTTNGKQTVLKHHIPNKLERAIDFSKNKNCSLIINASRWNTQNGKIYGVQIVDGVVMNDTPHTDNYILAFNNAGEMKHYPPTTSASTILSEGYTNTVTGFYPLMENGKPTDYHVGNSYGWGEKHPRQVIGKLKNDDFFVFTVEGRIGKQQGMTYAEMQSVLSKHNVNTAFDLDSGGSVQTIINGNKINVSSDTGDTQSNSRPVIDFIYIENEDNLYSDLSRELSTLSERLSSVSENVKNLTDIHKGFLRLYGTNNQQGVEVYDDGQKKSKYFFTPTRFSMWDYDEGKTIFSLSKEFGLTYDGRVLGQFNDKVNQTFDINNINIGGIYWASASTAGNAYDGDTSHATIHFEHSANDAMQLAIPYNNSTSFKMKMRRKGSGGAWQDWREL